MIDHDTSLGQDILKTAVGNGVPGAKEYGVKDDRLRKPRSFERHPGPDFDDKLLTDRPSHQGLRQNPAPHPLAGSLP
ncbi:hypothetical protein ACFQFQ_25165 [Sulfitobacter porphyrae]|uniref:Uncharacterized protein n=1 Tax=Sulfitobacter porphyrae TaxID=1246864 RepID=A0ABW2B8H5_9RHOB